jgi:hypothetical protein
MHLVIDLANQVILPQFKQEAIEQWMKRIVKRLKFVLMISERWRLRPIFVCDAGYTTEEVQQKWKLRREKELEKGCRKIPYCADTIVCELILRKKLNLVFDRRYNADDIVATIANMHPESIILSRDLDYFRYDDAIFKNRVFYIGDERKITPLGMKTVMRDPLQTIRMYFPIFATKNSDFVKFVKSGLYIRGTAYPIAERSESSSLHLATRKYRQILYTANVREIFPIWTNNRVTWTDEIVHPKDGMLPNDHNLLLNDVMSCVGGCVDYHHRLTIIIMVCELLCVQKESSILSELETFIKLS